MDIKEENPLLDDVASVYLTMEGNSDDIILKTTVKSETVIIKHPEEIKYETATCSKTWNVETKTGLCEQTLVSNFGSQNEENILPENPVMKDEKYNVDHEVYSKIEIKEEPWWLETETSSVCDDIRDADFYPVECSRLCMESVPGESPLSTSEVRYHLQYEGEKSDAREMSTAEEHALLEQSGQFNDKIQTSLRPLDLKVKVASRNHKRLRRCNICAKEFKDSYDLKRHMLIHEGKKPHQCEICGKCFTQMVHLKTHSFLHGKKSHQCEICGKCFTQMVHLKRHAFVHEGKKPHQCNRCDKGFHFLSYLKRHIMIHEGKKPYHCKTCDKHFTRLSNLKRHNLIHEGK